MSALQEHWPYPSNRAQWLKYDFFLMAVTQLNTLGMQCESAPRKLILFTIVLIYKCIAFCLYAKQQIIPFKLNSEQILRSLWNWKSPKPPSHISQTLCLIKEYDFV